MGDKGNGRRKGNSGLIFVMAMVTGTAMATTTTAMIDHCSFHDSDGTIVAIIYFSFYIQ